MVVAIDEVKGRQEDDRTDCRGDLVAAALFILRPNRLCRPRGDPSRLFANLRTGQMAELNR